jgi:uncharacterized protein (DUF433 family)
MKRMAKRMVLTRRDVRFIAGRFKAGMNSHEIATAYGYPEQVVLDAIRREREQRLEIGK